MVIPDNQHILKNSFDAIYIILVNSYKSSYIELIGASLIVLAHTALVFKRDYDNDEQQYFLNFSLIFSVMIDYIYINLGFIDRHTLLNMRINRKGESFTRIIFGLIFSIIVILVWGMINVLIDGLNIRFFKFTFLILLYVPTNRIFCLMVQRTFYNGATYFYIWISIIFWHMFRISRFNQDSEMEFLFIFLSPINTFQLASLKLFDHINDQNFPDWCNFNFLATSLLFQCILSIIFIVMDKPKRDNGIKISFNNLPDNSPKELKVEAQRIFDPQCDDILKIINFS